MPNVLIELNPFVDGTFQAPSFNGEGHNEDNVNAGATGSELINIAPLNYEDGISAPAGSNRPDPRTISNAVAQQNGLVNSPQGLTNMVWAMGQFLDHDLSLTPALSRQEAAAQGETMDIPIPLDDPYLNPGGVDGIVINLNRSAAIEDTGDSIDHPRQLPNEITAWIDGSNIYGSSDERAALLRSFAGGRLKTSDGNLLPIDPGNNNDNPGPATELFIAGDVRANENVVLSSMHTLFVREHNRLADALASEHSDWTDERVFQRARQLNVAQFQHIVFEEYLPAILGRSLDAYEGYDASINPGISRTFSTAAFRFGHTMVSPEIARLNHKGEVIDQGNINLADAFFPNADNIRETGIDAILRGSVSTLSQNADTKVINELRNLLFSFGGRFAAQDLKSLNIQRGRDHGLADYNTVRDSFGLTPVTDFSEITSDVALQTELESLYGSVDNIDAVVGLFAENPANGAAFGETIAAVLVDQFSRLRDGDRFYYRNVLTESEISAIETTSMADILQRNTDSRFLQDNVFTLKHSGSRHDDQMYGGLGDDTLYGKGRNDKLLGSFGNDHLFGDNGNDTLKGDDGNDFLDGGYGDDRLYGRSGNDSLKGNAGQDFLSAGFGEDRLDGGKGDDTLIGGAGNDYLVGGINHDRLMGGSGKDTLMGANTNKKGSREQDTLIGGGGLDLFILGSGRDIFYGADGDADYANVVDFKMSQDKLVLHGSRDQYSTRKADSSVRLLFDGGENSELIAVFSGEFSLDNATVVYR